MPVDMTGVEIGEKPPPEEEPGDTAADAMIDKLTAANAELDAVLEGG